MFRIIAHDSPYCLTLNEVDEYVRLYWEKASGFLTIANVMNFLEKELGMDVIYPILSDNLEKMHGWDEKRRKIIPIVKNESILNLDDIVIEFEDPISIEQFNTTKASNMNNGPETFDLVSNPAHYCKDVKYEPRKVIYDWKLNFNLGNAVKYIAKAGKKGAKEEDLKKAMRYIEFELEEMRNAENE